ncbi:HupE/UreJ family protein [Gorillibacterium sp. CAU 1737]|uniref:HupE/UreJ family protein n=1 Tax=Gorillibacterium sp. CAU 1737 TaxID=3140362 RepID=UPI003260AA8D
MRNTHTPMLSFRRHLYTVVLLLTLIGCLLTEVKPAMAHLNTYGYSDIKIGSGQLTYDLYLDPREVSQWMDLRSDGIFVLDPNASSNEPADPEKVVWTNDELMPLLEESLSVKASGEAVAPIIDATSIEARGGASYLKMSLRYAWPSEASDYDIDYRIFFNEDPGHQNYATIRTAEGGSKDMIFTKGNHEAAGQLALSGKDAEGNHTTLTVPNWLVTLWDYTKLGVEHIWTGIDHLLFITALVLVRQRKWGYVKVLTAFTVGHSITIVLAALDIFNLPASFVEPVIALSIAYVAFENIWLKEVRWRWIVALCFGLIHGFGFAQVLRGALGDRYLLSLFSFNVGVELGQLAVLAVLLPLLLWAARFKSYKRISYVLSTVIGLTGLYWFVTRLL